MDRLPSGAGAVVMGLKCCGVDGTFDCEVCPYWNRSRQSLSICRTLLHEDALRVMKAALGDEGNGGGRLPPREEKAARSAPKKARKKGEADIEEKRAYDRDYGRKRRARFKAMGLCTYCGKVPPVKGLTKCRACKEKEYAARLRWAAKKRGIDNGTEETGQQ